MRNGGDSDVSTEPTETSSPPNDADPSVSNRKRKAENRDLPLLTQTRFPLVTQTRSKESLAKEKSTDEESPDVEREPGEAYFRYVKPMNHDEMYAQSMQWTYYDGELSDFQDD